MSPAIPALPESKRFSASGRAPAAILRIAATALAGSLVCAAMVRFSPGFAMDETQLDTRISPATRQALARSYDAERNIWSFSFTYLKQALRGNLGVSQSLNRPIAGLLEERAPVTARIMAWGIAGAWFLAMAMALVPPLFRLPALGAAFTLLSGLAAALPAAAIAIVLFRLGGAAPATISLILFPKLYYYLRNLVRQSYNLPHVLLARAKGLGPWRILLRHVLPSAGPQMIALAAVSVNMAFGAAIAVEAICDLPGLGQLAWKAALARDLPVLVVLTMIITVVTQLANLMADACTPARSRA